MNLKTVLKTVGTWTIILFCLAAAHIINDKNSEDLRGPNSKDLQHGNWLQHKNWLKWLNDHMPVFVKNHVSIPDDRAPLFDQGLVQIAKEINKTLPMQLDRDTRLDTTMAGPGKRLTYFYTLLNSTSKDTTEAEIINFVKPKLINGYKTHSDMAMFREQGVELIYTYFGNDKTLIATIKISPKDF